MPGVLCVIIVLLLLCNVSVSFRFIQNNQRLIHHNIIKTQRPLSSSSSDNLFDEDLIESDSRSISEEISDIIDMYLVQARSQPMNTINPSVIRDKSYMLAKDQYFETIMQEKLSSPTLSSSDTALLEQINMFLSSIILSERRSRARLKVNYILASIRAEKLEEAIELLCEADEIDSHLMNFLESLIDKEMKRLKGPLVLEEGDDDNEFEGVGKATLTTLRAIKKRLQVEYQMKDRFELKLLSKMLSINDPARRDDIMLESFTKVEDLDNFLEFVSEGVDHFLQMSKQEDEDFENDDETTEKTDKRHKRTIEDREKLTTETYGKMKDILASLKTWKKYLETGLVSDDIFSTSEDDYMGKSFQNAKDKISDSNESELGIP